MGEEERGRGGGKGGEIKSGLMKGRVRQSGGRRVGGGVWGGERMGEKNAGWGRKAHARTRRGFVLKAPRWRDWREPPHKLRLLDFSFFPF